jgi:hypothetical protein
MSSVISPANTKSQIDWLYRQSPQQLYRITALLIHSENKKIPPGVSPEGTYQIA